jgi:hypothetical protein
MRLPPCIPVPDMFRDLAAVWADGSGSGPGGVAHR